MNQLVIDVGNTETVAGLFAPGSLEVLAECRYVTSVPRTPDELALLVRGLLAEAGYGEAEIVRSVLGSVVPRQTEVLTAAIGLLGGGRIIVLEGVEGLPIRLDVDEPPGGVGVDRIANTLAAAELYRRDTLVVDLGTATTYDCITAAGVFSGGVIAPGLRAGEEWLAGKTARLPRVSFGPPAEVIGRRTEACLRSGVFYSAIDAVDGLVGRILAEWGRPDALVVATGGHARAVAGHSRYLRTVNPELTLVGLQIAGNHLAGGESAG